MLDAVHILATEIHSKLIQMMNDLWLQLICYVSTHHTGHIFQRVYLERLKGLIHPKGGKVCCHQH